MGAGIWPCCPNGSEVSSRLLQLMRNGLIGDLRVGARSLLRYRAYAAAAILTLSLGMAVSGGVFSFADGILLRPLAFPDSDQLVLLHESTPDSADMAVAYPNFLDWKSGARSFKSLAALQGASFRLTGRAEPQLLPAAGVSADFFDVLRTAPFLGRTFRAEDDRTGAQPVVILSHALWRRSFGADRSIVGQSITLDKQSFTVVGVLSEKFVLPITDAELWVPIGLWSTDPELLNRGSHPDIDVLGRLKPGYRLEAARRELATIAARLEQDHPETNVGHRVTVTPLLAYLVGGFRRPLLVLLATGILVLLISWANVANLMLSRVLGRQQELDVRAALGAGAWRLALLILSESVLLSGLGFAIGLLLTFWGVHSLVALAPAEIPRLSEVRVDWRVAGTLGAAALLTGLAFGLVPALSALRLRRSRVDHGGTRGGQRAFTQSRLRAILVAAEAAIVVVVSIGAALLTLSFWHLRSANLGLDPDRILVGTVALPTAKYPTNEAREAFISELLSRLRALPKVEVAAVTRPLPLSGNVSSTAYAFEGQEEPAPGTPHLDGDFATISPDYFRALRIPLLKGRTFDARDGANGHLVAVVDEVLADHCWPGQNSVGKRVKLNGSPSARRPWLEVIGVVGHVSHLGATVQTGPKIYVPIAQMPDPQPTFLVRTQGPPSALVASVRKAVFAVDPEQPAYDVRPMQELVAATQAENRLALLLMSLFGLAALNLGATGLYAVISQWVAERRHEIAIRLAIGAQPGQIVRLISGHALRLSLLGLALGLPLAYFVAPALGTLLFKTPPRDPLIFAAATVALLALTLAASYSPLRRALAIDPASVLR